MNLINIHTYTQTRIYKLDEKVNFKENIYCILQKIIYWPILTWIYLVNIILRIFGSKEAFNKWRTERDGIFVAFTLPLIPHKFAWQSYRGRFTKQRYWKRRLWMKQGTGSRDRHIPFTFWRCNPSAKSSLDRYRNECLRVCHLSLIN